MFREIWNKLAGVLDDVVEGKDKFKKVKSSGILELFLLVEIKSKELNEQIYGKLHQVIEKETSIKNFSYLLKLLHKVGKHISKR